MKALQLAAQQGQKIYQIDGDNLYTALGDIAIGLEVENEIRQAVLNGKIAITHQSNIQVPGWSGAGYLILDPDLMDGSYKLSGGGNGSFFKELDAKEIVAKFLQTIAAMGEAIFDFLGELVDYGKAGAKVFAKMFKALGLSLGIYQIFENCTEEQVFKALAAYLIIFSYSVFAGIVLGAFLGAVLVSFGVGAIIFSWAMGLLLGAMLERLLTQPAIKNIWRDE